MAAHPTRLAIVLALLGLSAAACVREPSADPGGAAFIVRLGLDTIAVEQYARTGDRIEAVSVSRSPRTAVRRLTVSLDADGAVVSVKITRETIRALQAEKVDPTEITTPLLAMDGVKVAILFRELEDGRIKVSLRSKGSLDVHRLAIEFGGGGHRNASGIVMNGSLDQAVETVAGRAAALLGLDQARQSG